MRHRFKVNNVERQGLGELKMSSAEVATVAGVGDRSGEDSNLEAAKVREYAAFDVLRFVLAFAVLLSRHAAFSRGFTRAISPSKSSLH